MSRFKIERRCEHDESLRPGKSLERDIALLAYNAASAVGADQIGARMRFDAVGATHINADQTVSLRDVHHLVRKQHLDVGQLS